MNWHLFVSREIYYLGKKILSISPNFFLRGCQQNRSKAHNPRADKDANSFFTATSPESADTTCFHKSLFQLPSYLSLRITVTGIDVAKDKVKARWYFKQQSCHRGLAREDMSQAEANLIRSQNNLRKLHSSHRT